MPHLLARIHALGEDLCAALAGESIEQADALMQERGVLVEQLKTYGHPSEVCADWQRYAAQLAAQHQVLSEVMRAQEERLREAQRGLHRFRGAQHSYGAPAGRTTGQLLQGRLNG